MSRESPCKLHAVVMVMDFVEYCSVFSCSRHTFDGVNILIY